jgi:hypothetical protein
VWVKTSRAVTVRSFSQRKWTADESRRPFIYHFRPLCVLLKRRRAGAAHDARTCSGGLAPLAITTVLSRDDCRLRNSNG